jgi:hypothetical protein
MKMLRKSSHIILSILLLFATIGLTISKHYCGGNHVSTSIFGEAEPCCDSDDCCKNETESYQLDENYSSVSISEVPQSTKFQLVDLTILIFDHTKFNLESINDFFVANSPPPLKIQTFLSQIQTYLL